MLRYFAIMSPVRDARAETRTLAIRERIAQAHPDWRLVCDAQGMTVFSVGAATNGGRTLQLPDDAGVIVGTLFESKSGRQLSALTSAVSTQVLTSSGRSLVGSHWGSYVLFLKDPSKERVIALRGPMSSLGCLWISIDGVIVIFSEPDDYLSLRLGQLNIAWDIILAQAAGGDYLAHRTSISELQTLVSGEALIIGANPPTRCTYWSPATVPSPLGKLDLHTAASMLGEATDSCIRAWLSSHQTCLVQISGGLDSSIVLATAKRVAERCEIIGVNFWSPGAGDERSYARSMAARAQVEIMELERSPSVDFGRLYECSRTANPPVHFTAFDSEPTLIRLAHTRNATAIITGELGDDIFGHAPEPEALAEAQRTFGWSPDFLRAAVDYADLTRLSVWRVIQKTMEYRSWQRLHPYWSLFAYKKRLGLQNNVSLASDTAIREYETAILPHCIHPWLRDVRSVPSGQLMLIWAAAYITSPSSHPPFAGEAADLFITPLASQPLIESFCRIPSHLHFAHGENGAVARAAFRARLSQAVIDRGTGKGTPDQWIQGLIVRNRHFLRDFLCGGLLAREGILDRRKTEHALDNAVTATKVGVAEVVRQAYIEGWLRNWMNATRRAAA